MVLRREIVPRKSNLLSSLLGKQYSRIYKKLTKVAQKDLCQKNRFQKLLFKYFIGSPFSFYIFRTMVGQELWLQQVKLSAATQW